MCIRDRVPIESKNFGRIATQNAKNVILQKIREEERKVLYNDYYSKEKDVVTCLLYTSFPTIRTIRSRK